jgi:hypothetical protein
MKDLFVLTADADAEAVIKTILARHKDLGIRRIEADVKRFPGRDPGMVKEGPEIARAMVRKSEYNRLILVWDHQGSGWDAQQPEAAVQAIEQRLTGVTWKDRSAAVVAVPELEEWIWRCQPSLAKHLGVSTSALQEMTDRFPLNKRLSREELFRKHPKELFEFVLYLKERRKPLPNDFVALAQRCRLEAWRGSRTFARLVETLKTWFPVRAS